MFEDSEFGSGTKQLLQILERQTTRGCTTIVCGGDTVAAAEKFCCANFSHISMGGGASLELLAGRELPGVSIINDSVLSI